MTERPEERLTFAFAPDCAISYRVEGRGPVPVVFIHGFAAALTTWNDITPLFPPERFTLHLLDLKGFGFSSKPRRGSYSVEEQAEMVLAFMEARRIEGAVLVGHSLGGGIALLALLTAMDRGKAGLVSRLVLIDAAAYPQRPPLLMRLLRLPLLPRIGMALLPVRLIVIFTLRRVFHDHRAITPERVRRYETCFGRRGIARVLIRSARALTPESYGEVAARYREVGVPTLIVWGREDRIVDFAQGMRLQAEIPGARLAVIEGCGHNPHEERPRETWEVIGGFLEEKGGVKVMQQT